MSIESHIDRVWNYFNSIDKNMYRIKYPSIPLVYFGDYISYKKSPIKIVTLGLNPSYKEFPGNNKFSRFYETANLYEKEKLSQKELLIYLRALNIYFDVPDITELSFAEGESVFGVYSLPRQHKIFKFISLLKEMLPHWVQLKLA